MLLSMVQMFLCGVGGGVGGATSPAEVAVLANVRWAY